MTTVAIFGRVCALLCPCSTTALNAFTHVLGSGCDGPAGEEGDRALSRSGSLTAVQRPVHDEDSSDGVRTPPAFDVVGDVSLLW
jgi:hypothetical protein